MIHLTSIRKVNFCKISVTGRPVTISRQCKNIICDVVLYGLDTGWVYRFSCCYLCLKNKTFLARGYTWSNGAPYTQWLNGWVFFIGDRANIFYHFSINKCLLSTTCVKTYFNLHSHLFCSRVNQASLVRKVCVAHTVLLGHKVYRDQLVLRVREEYQ